MVSSFPRLVVGLPLTFLQCLQRRQWLLFSGCISLLKWDAWAVIRKLNTNSEDLSGISTFIWEATELSKCILACHSHTSTVPSYAVEWLGSGRQREREPDCEALGTFESLERMLVGDIWAAWSSAPGNCNQRGKRIFWTVEWVTVHFFDCIVFRFPFCFIFLFQF